MSTGARTLRRFQIDQIKDHTPMIRELVLSLVDGGSFQFKAGQFAMLHVPQTDKPALRAYSIASTDEQTDGFRLIFKFVENGLASNYVWSLKVGELLNFTGPFGRLLFREPPSPQIVFLNTGSGVAQHLCYLTSNIKKYPHLRYRLLFGVRNESDIYYQNELHELQKSFTDFQFEYVLSRPSDSWTGKKGYVQNFISAFDYLAQDTTFYLCGNGAMIKDVKHQLIERDGFDQTKIFAEAFD